MNLVQWHRWERTTWKTVTRILLTKQIASKSSSSLAVTFPVACRINHQNIRSWHKRRHSGLMHGIFEASKEPFSILSTTYRRFGSAALLISALILKSESNTFSMTISLATCQKPWLGLYISWHYIELQETSNILHLRGKLDLFCVP